MNLSLASTACSTEMSSGSLKHHISGQKPSRRRRYRACKRDAASAYDRQGDVMREVPPPHSINPELA
jgi:hypothetical protein